MRGSLGWGVAALAIVLGASCAPRPRPQPAIAPSPPEVIALVADPESGVVGAATVTNPDGAVDLRQAGDSTTVRPGQGPTPPAVLPESEIQRLFGDALGAIAPPARRFLLYFDTGSDTLTAASRALVPEILGFVKASVAPDVSIVGHTDTTGAAPANVVLGLRRAALIRGLLLAAGLDDRLVEVASHGEANPVVPTPDNTAEARNRRVEVTVR